MQQATPTEYKGVRYRSKSEAMFAMYLDLFSQSIVGGHIAAAGYAYEPPGFNAGDYQVDFMLWSTTVPEAYFSDDELRRPMIAFNHYDLIEYKPKRPTKTYIKNARARYLAILDHIDQLGFENIRNYISFDIYFGSPYVGEKDVGIISFEYTFDSERESWLEPYRDQIRNHRFDLEDQA